MSFAGLERSAETWRRIIMTDHQRYLELLNVRCMRMLICALEET